MMLYLNRTPMMWKLEDSTHHPHMNFIKAKRNSDSLERSHFDATATESLNVDSLQLYVW